MIKIFTIISSLFFALLLLVGVAVYLVYASSPDRFNVLVIGTDQRASERSRSDVLMLFSIPKDKSKAITLLTIPRDTYVDIPSEGMDKITHAYVYGDALDGKLGNVHLTSQTVQGFLGVPVHATLEYNFVSFQEIIDLVGGVSIDGVAADADDALAQVRDRYRGGGDFARAEDQREVFGYVLERVKNRAVASELFYYMNTSDNARILYSRKDLFHFGLGFLLNRWGKVSIGAIDEQVIPGEGGRKYSNKIGKELYFWIPNEQELQVLIDEKLR